MPIVSVEGQRVLFIHIPRTGGTSIEHWLRSFGPLTFFSYAIPSFSKVTPQHFRIADIEELLGDDFFDYAFALVRNPFSRVTSEYRVRAKQKVEGVWSGAPRFATWLENVLRATANSPFHLDNHLRPQWEFLSSRVQVFRYEDGVDAAVAQVAARLGVAVPPALPRRQDTSDVDAPVHFDIAETERVLAAYAPDFERFGYSKTPPS